MQQCLRARRTVHGRRRAAIWRRAVAGKLFGHGINDPGFLQPARPMSAIGG
jgi:hypothetical protein